jgi:DNA-binding winged helix-turn-helix (wHTH) protein
MRCASLKLAKQATTTTIGLMLYRFASCALDLTRGSLRVDDDDVELRPKAFAVLRHFVENPGRLIPKDELIRAVWSTTVVSDESLINCISEIRRAICDHDQSVIKTVSRRGYLLAADVARSTAMEVRLGHGRSMPWPQ